MKNEVDSKSRLKRIEHQKKARLEDTKHTEKLRRSSPYRRVQKDWRQNDADI